MFLGAGWSNCKDHQDSDDVSEANDVGRNQGSEFEPDDPVLYAEGPISRGIWNNQEPAKMCTSLLTLRTSPPEFLSTLLNLLNIHPKGPMTQIIDL